MLEIGEIIFEQLLQEQGGEGRGGLQELVEFGLGDRKVAAELG